MTDIWQELRTSVGKLTVQMDMAQRSMNAMSRRLDRLNTSMHRLLLFVLCVDAVLIVVLLFLVLS